MVGKSMVRNLLSEASFDDLAPLLTPGLFRVLPLRTMLSQVKEIYDSRREAEPLLHELRAYLSRSALGVQMAESPAASQISKDTMQAKLQGERILHLYFAQILSRPITFVDLRPSALFVAEQIEYRPARALVRWEAEFIDPLRDVYRGFYTQDDERYRSGMGRLNLGEAADIFEEHFGGEDQSHVEFRTQKLVNTLRQVFEVCRSQRRQVHPNFIPFGAYLAGLYQSLELLGARYDVGAAFREVDALGSGIEAREG